MKFSFLWNQTNEDQLEFRLKFYTFILVCLQSQSQSVLVKVAGWRVFGGLGLSCGGKNSLGRADFSWILEYLEEKSWESIGIKNFRSF